MRKIFFLGLALTGFGAYFYYNRQVNLLKNMKYSIQDVKILDRSQKLWRAEITLNVKNNSDIPFTLTGWNFDLSINNEQVSKILDTKQKISVGANGGVTPLKFIVEFSPENYGLLDIVASLINTGKKTNITIDGNVSVYSGLLMSNKSPVNITWKLQDFM
jgi:LEA14-like dessication related protein